MAFVIVTNFCSFAWADATMENPQSTIARYQQFCEDPIVRSGKGLPRAWKYYEPSKLCSDQSAQNYRATSSWFKIVGWIHLAHWQKYIPVVNRDLACVIKKIYLTLSDPSEFCESAFRFTQFAKDTSLEPRYLVTVLEIILWKEKDLMWVYPPGYF